MVKNSTIGQVIWKELPLTRWMELDGRITCHAYLRLYKGILFHCSLLSVHSKAYSKHNIEEQSFFQAVTFCGKEKSLCLIPLKYISTNQRLHLLESSWAGSRKEHCEKLSQARKRLVHHQTLHALHLVENHTVVMEEDFLTLERLERG